jgi:hypothetical protein
MVGVATDEEQVLKVMRHAPTVGLLIETSCMNDEGEVGLDHAFVAHQDHAVRNPKLCWTGARRERVDRAGRVCRFLSKRGGSGEKYSKDDGETAVGHYGPPKITEPAG